MRSYEYRHVIGFEDTNVVGNVYYLNHLRWQGRCREMFLREHLPHILDDMNVNLRLVTVRCSCEYLGELNVFEEIAVRMRLAAIVQNRVAMNFEYWLCKNGEETLVARGEQEIACMRSEGSKLVPAPVPPALRSALDAYAR